MFLGGNYELYIINQYNYLNDKWKLTLILNFAPIMILSYHIVSHYESKEKDGEDLYEMDCWVYHIMGTII